MRKRKRRGNTRDPIELQPTVDLDGMAPGCARTPNRGTPEEQLFGFGLAWIDDDTEGRFFGLVHRPRRQ